MATTLRQRSKRAIYKNVLQSPFRFNWPVLDKDRTDQLLSLLDECLAPIGDCRRELQRQRKLKRSSKDVTAPADDCLDTYRIIMESLVLGVNSIAKSLQKPSDSRITKSNETTEDVLDPAQSASAVADSSTPRSNNMTTSVNPIRVLLICTEDVEPSARLIYAHLPILAHWHGNIRFCPLPKGTEQWIAKKCHLRRPLAMGIKASKHFANLIDWIDQHIQPLQVPWLPSTLQPISRYIPATQERVETTRKKPPRK